MTKNVKSIFFVLVLVTLLVTVGAVCAADDVNGTAATESSVSDAATIPDTASDTIAAEHVTTKSNDNYIDTKRIEKEEKSIKISTKTVEVNNWDELQSAINDATEDTENDEYIINLNDGTYKSPKIVNFESENPTLNIIINGNGQTVEPKRTNTQINIMNNANITLNNFTFQSIFINNEATVTLNNILFESERIENYKTMELNNVTFEEGNIENDFDCDLTIKNSTLNTVEIINLGTIIIDDDVIFGDEFTITGGNIIISNPNILIPHISEFYGNYTINNIEIYDNIRNGGNLTFKNVTMNAIFINNGKFTIENSTMNNEIKNSGTLIISEDSLFGENFKITGKGEILTNNTHLLVEYVKIWETDMILNNEMINSPKTSYGTLTLNNCTINSTITNEGTIIIDDNTIFTENAKIIGNGKIIINNIIRILPIIDILHGNYEINDTTLIKNYEFNGVIILNNCTITNPNNTNFGTLTLNKCNVDVGEEETFITNYGTLNIDDDTNIIGKTVDLVSNGAYIVTQDTIGYFFDQTGLNQIVKPGDTLDIQGMIILNQSLIVNKPVKIISTTNDAYIDLNTTAGSMFGDEPGNCFVINKDGAYTNVTGIYFHNTQLWIYNTHHVILDNISAVVENRAVGSGVGQTSIRANSTYITLKNSFIYTENNGGSSSVVLAWAENCIIENNTIQGVGTVGNLLYITTYNIDIPEGIVPNVNNQILNNIIIGPEEGTPICVSIMISGANNTIGNNQIYYVGGGIGGQWDGEGYIDTKNNTFFNNSQKYHQPEIELIVDTSEFTIGEATTITASIYYTNKIQTDINKGKVTFKVNGKTLKDANGKVIYAKVINGVATIENYLIPDDWAKEGTTIEAVYSGSTQCEKLTSEKTNITITSPEATITVTPITSDVQTGSTVTLKAKVAIGDKAITTGKIVFKVNGKTVKDANGKVIYAKVDSNGEVSVDYTIPESFKAGTCTVEAVFTASGYDKLTSNTTMTVVKS